METSDVAVVLVARDVVVLGAVEVVVRAIEVVEEAEVVVEGKPVEVEVEVEPFPPQLKAARARAVKTTARTMPTIGSLYRPSLTILTSGVIVTASLSPFGCEHCHGGKFPGHEVYQPAFRALFQTPPDTLKESEDVL